VAVLGGGKILTLGRVGNSTDDFALAQLSSNGQLDNSFGTGGKVTTDLAGVDDFGETFAIQPDGKIIAAGFTGDILSVTQFAMVRYTPTGAIDNTFGVNGKVTTALTTHDEAYAIALQPDLKILLAGRAFNGSNNDFGITRYQNNGVLDSTFDADGKVIVPIGTDHDEAFSLALQTDGKIVVGGRSWNGTDDFALIRLQGDIMTAATDITPDSKQKIQLYPSPACGILNISNIYKDKSIIEIYDLSGRMVYSTTAKGQTQIGLNIELLEQGTFLCRVSDGQQSQTLLFNKINFY